ncbi:MAG: hypothetical protein GXY86_11790 [Firmicutes bacterium]|nr:hypothetical protein [Bacillota bacterium]
MGRQKRRGMRGRNQKLVLISTNNTQMLVSEILRGDLLERQEQYLAHRV